MSSWPYYFPLGDMKDSFWGYIENCPFSLFQTLTHIHLHTTHHSLFSALKWTSLVGSRRPSSSAWQCCGKGLPGTSTSFPSFFAGPCMPAHSHGTAGRSIRPEAQSYSSTCSRTAKGQQVWFRSRPRTCHLWKGSGEGEGHPPGTNQPGVPASESCSPCQKTSKHRWPADQQGMNTVCIAWCLSSPLPSLKRSEALCLDKKNSNETFWCLKNST